MIETYTFIKTDQNVTSFARVQVEFIPRNNQHGIKICEAIIEPVNREAGEFAPNERTSWFSAALNAMKVVADKAATIGVDGELRLRKLIGSITDTSDDAVSCAAGLAAFRLLIPTHPMPVVSEKRPWELIWPNE